MPYNKVQKKVTNYAETSWENYNKAFPRYQTTVKKHIKAFKLQWNKCITVKYMPSNHDQLFSEFLLVGMVHVSSCTNMKRFLFYVEKGSNYVEDMLANYMDPHLSILSDALKN